MTNTIRPQSWHNVLPRRYSHANGLTTVRGVRQDNPAPTTAPPATPQPAPPKKETRTAPKKTDTHHTHQKKPHVGKDVQLNLWVRPVIKAELERIAKREGLSVSATGEALLEQALQQDMHTQQGALLEPIIDKAIGKHMRAYSNRLAVLLVRSLFSSEQTRSFVYNLLVRQAGITDETLTAIKNGASTTARATITRVSPQMKTLLEAVQTWLEKEVRDDA